jgi:hypothetical protein
MAEKEPCPSGGTGRAGPSQGGNAQGGRRHDALDARRDYGPASSRKLRAVTAMVQQKTGTENPCWLPTRSGTI